MKRGKAKNSHITSKMFSSGFQTSCHLQPFHLIQATENHCVFFRSSQTAVRSWPNKTRCKVTKLPVHSWSPLDEIFGSRNGARAAIRLTDWYMGMQDVLIVAICMKHRPEQPGEITYFFWCMDPTVEPSSRRVQPSCTLRGDPFERIHSPLSLWQARGNGWGARFHQKAHLHPHDNVFHKGEAAFFEQGPSWSFPTHGPHKQLGWKTERNEAFLGKKYR